MKDSQLSGKKKRLFIRKNLSTKKRGKIVASKKEQSLSKPPIRVNSGENNFVLFVIPFILLVIYLGIYTFNHHLRIIMSANKLSRTLDIKAAAFPVLSNNPPPVLSAKAAIVQDLNSQTILYAKNLNLRFSTASTAKIMTALIALEYYQPDSILTIKSRRVEGSGLNFQYGDKFNFMDLMYAMLLPSANDAAAALADNYPGGREGFVAKMNEKAQSLHLRDTHFSDSIGLDDDGNYSTVVDMERLSAIAMKNPDFRRIVATGENTILNTQGTRQYTFSNLNKLLGFNGVNGIKTGTTEGAGEVLVTSAVINGHTFIIITMNSQDRFGDTATLLDYVARNVKFVNLAN